MTEFWNSISNKWKIGIGIVLLVVFFRFIAPKDPVRLAEATSVKSKSELRQEKIKGGFSSFDGSHYELTKYIKVQMNDDDSFEHIETTYSDKGKYILIETRFKGKNVFGGIVKQSIQAKADTNGNLIEILK